MKTIIAHTDFSDSSRNALNYACDYAMMHHNKVLLVHIYTVPASYAAEGVSLAAVHDGMEAERQQLQDELDRIRLVHPHLPVSARLVTGDFMESLQELRQQEDPGIIVFGAAGEYSDVLQWDDDWLSAVTSLLCPVMVIPQHITYKPLRHIAFACDYKAPCPSEQVGIIRQFVQHDAELHIVHITADSSLVKDNKHAAAIESSFREMHPTYHTIENRLIIKGVAEFVREHKIDLLIVAPHRHGFWDSLFNKSYTRQLALLREIPVLAIHEG